jgi:DNA-binding MarR family transcriptional regulator
MGEGLKKWLKMDKEIPLRESVDLNIRVASALLEGKFNSFSEKFNITISQYNVLRILKGVYPEGHARCELASRMIERSPDITRLIDRLEKQGLVERDRNAEDRRMSITRITKKGLKIIDEIDPMVEKGHTETTKNLTDAECKELSRLLEKYYEVMT